jgi:hypothetical protein
MAKLNLPTMQFPPPIRGRVREGVKWLSYALHSTSIQALLLLSLLLSPLSAQAESDTAPIFKRFATQLTQQLPPQSRVAIEPLRYQPIGIPREIAAQIDDQIYHALHQQRKAEMRLLARSQLRQIWREIGEFESREINQQLEDARADILVLARTTAVATGVELRYQAYALQDGKTGQLLASTEPAILTHKQLTPTPQRLEIAIAQSVERVLPQLTLLLNGEPLQIKQIGPVGDLRDYITIPLIQQLIQRTAEQARKQEVNISRSLERSKPRPTTTLTLQSDLWKQPDSLKIQLTLQSPDQQQIQLTLMIALDPTLQQMLQGVPLGRIHNGYRQTTAGAEIGRAFENRRAATQAARIAARAALIRMALMPGSVQNSATVTASPLAALSQQPPLMRETQRAITVDEQWQGTPHGNRVEQTLRARVVQLANPPPQNLKATLQTEQILAGEPIQINLTPTTRHKLYLGVFVWQADDTVVRIYPQPSKPQFTLNTPLQIPQPYEDQLTSYPMPGERANQEAIILLASQSPLDYAAMAPTVRTDIGQPFKARPVAQFWKAITEIGLELPRLQLQVLPYSVHQSTDRE